ncbi:MULTISPECIES: TolC family protein [unclassified Thioalkalivibrio]|uniref:TolC family protein n=1 Tax=unclassified Thioalkalivibrio TaxID=2621013 RepID=UPI000378B652|nr:MULTISPECIES: TolC family protein [unclassified Thioalkalivibrio]
MVIRSSAIRGLLLAGLLPVAAAADSLPQLLDAAEQAPSLLADQAAFERAEALRERRHQEGGWELFGNVGAGTYREPVVEGINRRYRGGSGSIGVRRPLLGTDEQQRRAQWQAQGEAGAAWYRYEEALQSLRRDIAEAYAQVWHARQQQRLSQSMLAVAPELDRALGERRDERLMREDEVAALKRMLDGARLDADEAAMEEREARVELEALLGRTVRLDATPAWFDPSRASCPAPDFEAAPEVLALEEELRAAEKRESLTRFHALQSDVQLRYNSTYEDDVSRLGSGLEIVWSVAVPLRALRGENALRREVRAEQSQLRYERAAATDAVAQRRELARERLGIHKRRLDASGRDMENAAQALKVVQERAQSGTAGSWDEVLSAREAFYRAAHGWLDAALGVWRAQIGCDRLASDRPQPVSRMKDARGVLEEGLVRESMLPGPVRIYLWDSEPVIQGSDPDFWPILDRAGVDHVWLSLDADQIARYAERPDALEALMGRARDRDVEVGLLLGEPTWVFPKTRQDLLDIIRKLERIGFADLHLDIEIDQLDTEAYGRERLLDYWLETVEAVAEITPWPVGLSAHPRDFGQPDRCLVCEFEEMGVDEVALMTYVTQIDGITQRLEPVLDRDSAVTITLAQSVESALPARNSWFHHGWEPMTRDLRAAMDVLDEPRLPVAIQSYSDLKDMWADEDTL